jgi:hypothetical protein
MTSPWPYTRTERWQLVGLIWLMSTWQLLILLPLEAVFLPVGKMEAVSHWLDGKLYAIAWNTDKIVAHHEALAQAEQHTHL